MDNRETITERGEGGTNTVDNRETITERGREELTRWATGKL